MQKNFLEEEWILMHFTVIMALINTLHLLSDYSFVHVSWYGKIATDVTNDRTKIYIIL